ncbi:MAG: hypothetical protein JRM80_04055 [Nitrososphaerota archaeon]|nr:hypothetical protein [Nitrososphaerota archaeon]
MASGAVITFGLNICSASVALLTSYYAYRSNRLVGNPVLGAISIGFMLLGVGLAVDAATALATGRILVEFPADRALFLLSSFTYLAIQMVAYLVIALGYARAAYGKRATEVAPVALAGSTLGLFGFSLFSYFLTIVLLAFVVFQGVLLRSGGKGGFSSVVLVGFCLILAAHLVLLVSVLTPGTALFLVGTGVQFFGFLSLLVFVVRSEVVGPR